MTLTDRDLLYAATARCRCGAGLAYPLDHDQAFKLGAWVCSAYLKGGVTEGLHDSLHWSMYKVREETSINNSGGATTRPAGTVARTVGKAKCPRCEWEWQSEPYEACGQPHHWFPGPCPNCSYAYGSGSTTRSGEPEPIDKRYSDVVLEA